jgi:hypothetical protein
VLDFEDTAVDSRTSSSGRRASELRLEELSCVYEVLSSSTSTFLREAKQRGAMTCNKVIIIHDYDGVPDISSRTGRLRCCMRNEYERVCRGSNNGIIAKDLRRPLRNREA